MTNKVMPFYQDVDGFRIPGAFSVEVFQAALAYKPRPDDLFVVTFPKCGTTWTQQIVTLILNKGKPIEDWLEFNSRTPFLEMNGSEGVQKMVRPGSIKIHLPFHKTPYSAEAKYIYVVRNPKDTVVSFYHHTRSNLYKYEKGEFSDYFELFLKGETDFGDYFDHVLGWYEHLPDNNVLFICYEEMKNDISNTVKVIARFMGEEYEDLLKDQTVFADVLKYSSLDYMKEVFNKVMDNTTTKFHESGMDFSQIPAGFKHILKQMAEYQVDDSKRYEIIRKGIVGDWRNHLTEDQNRRFDEKIEAKLKGTELYSYWKTINCI